MCKVAIDSLLASDLKLQEFLSWADRKSKSVQKLCHISASFKSVAIRAFYIEFTVSQSLGFRRELKFEGSRMLTSTDAGPHTIAADLALFIALSNACLVCDSEHTSSLDDYKIDSFSYYSLSRSALHKLVC